MKNFIWILGLVSIFMLTGCSSDETNLNNDCFVCTSESGDETTYCFNGDGHSYWVQVNNEDPYVLPLQFDKTWEQFKEEHSNCENITEGQTDCFDCVQDGVTTTYCFQQGEDFYTSQVEGGEEVEVPLNNQTWVQVRSQLLVLCENDVVDCFDCSVAGVDYTYCYTAGNAFYTRTANGETVNIDLATQSWAEVKASLQASCEDNTADCFSCTTAGITTTYCYSEGNGYYSVEVAGQTTNVLLGNSTWEQIKAALQESCQ